MPKYECKSVFLEITQNCNLLCKHCYNKSGREKNFYLNSNIIEKIVVIAKAMGVEKICISGGEPLLHPDIHSILKFANQYNVDFLLVTNGMLLEKFLEIIETNPYISIQISIDGLKDAHDKLRGEGAFEKAHNNIQKLNKRWALKCTVNSYNYSHLEEIIQYGVENNAHIVSFSFLNVVGRARDNEEIVLSSKELLAVSSNLQKLKLKYSEKINVEFPKLNCNNICPFCVNSPVYQISPRIDSRGNVFLCSMFSNEMFSLGNIKECGVFEVFNSDRFDKIINFLIAFKNLNECKNCFLNVACGRGCPASYLNSAMTIYRDDFCKARKRKFVEFLECYYENN